MVEESERRNPDGIAGIDPYNVLGNLAQGWPGTSMINNNPIIIKDIKLSQEVEKLSPPQPQTSSA